MLVFVDRSKLRPPDRYVGPAETYSEKTVSESDNPVIPETYARTMNSLQRENWLKAV